MPRDSHPITSEQNAQVKFAAGLRERRARERQRAYLVEGYREVSRYLQAVDQSAFFLPLSTLFYCQEHFLGCQEGALIENARVQGSRCVPLAKRAFDKISYRDRPDGILGIAPQVQRSLDQLPLTKCPFIVIAEGVEKPGNLGTLLRSADGAGVDALVLTERKTDLWNPNTVRASVGTLFTVPVCETSNDLLDPWLRKRELTLVAADPNGAQIYTDCDWKMPMALILGSEQYGLSDYWQARADTKVSIPMRGVADSLNIAVSGALVFYEALRQRSQR